MSPADESEPEDWGALWRVVLVLCAIALMAELGTWQLHRLNWKTDLIEGREKSLARPPFELKKSYGNPREIRFRRIIAQGVFLHEKEFVIGPRTRKGEAGWHVVTPLQFQNGMMVLVNRGWIPYRRKDPATRRAGLPSGTVQIEGVVRTIRAPGFFIPDNAPEKDDWYYFDIPALREHLGLKSLPDYIIDAGPAANKGGYPVGGQTIVRPVNRHLEYALTWYGLALVLAVIYVIDWRRRRREGKLQA
ncbi:MAG: SURF1 family protein [Alphaproteobacteria bacterium]